MARDLWRAIRDLASTIVELEQMQERQVTGEAISTGTYLTASNNRRRLLRELGLADGEDGEEQRDGAVSEYSPALVPDMDLELLTETELLWLSDVLERAIERAEKGFDCFESRGAEAIYAALRRICMARGRPYDFEMAANVGHYLWYEDHLCQPRKEGRNCGCRPRYDDEIVAGWHLEAEPQQFWRASAPDLIEAELAEHDEVEGWIEEPAVEIEPPAERLPPPPKALPKPEPDRQLEGEYIPPRKPRPIVHPEVEAAARRGDTSIVRDIDDTWGADADGYLWRR